MWHSSAHTPKPVWTPELRVTESFRDQWLEVPANGEHSLWELLEHLRIAQADILEFCRTAKYKEKKWPDDYWPATPAPRSASAWTKAIADYRRDRKAFQRLASNTRIDLLATIPHGTGQTYLREIVLAADHAAYHIGQIVTVRKQLGIWT